MYMYKCHFFNIKELVSDIVYNRFAENAWMFFNSNFLKDLDKIRSYYSKPIIINNWATGGQFKQCGLRSNLDDIVKNKTKEKKIYCSAHCMGKAVDMHCEDNKKLWELCHDLIEGKRLLCMTRLESLKSTKGGWVHIDCFQTDINGCDVF